MSNMELLARAETQFLREDRLDINLLDQVMSLMNRGSGEEQKRANVVMMQLKQDENAWSKVDAILQYSQQLESKYFALQVLESTVSTRWRALPSEQRDGIRSFILQFILKIASDPEAAVAQHVLLAKLNLVLVAIVKQDWPRNWPNFIPDLVQSSSVSDSLATNNMHIFRLLSEEVFDFGNQNLTQAKEQQLKQTLCGEFQQVFQLCYSILEKSENAVLVEATLRTLQRFLSWIPLGYVFETDIVPLLTRKYLASANTSLYALQCLTEVASINVKNQDASFGQKIQAMFMSTMEHMASLMGPDPSKLTQAYKEGNENDQRFITQLAQFLCTFLKEHSSLVETPSQPDSQSAQLLDYSMRVLLAISRIRETELFKLCLDYWCWLTSDLYRESPFSHVPLHVPGFLDRNGTSTGLREPPRRALYRAHLSDLRTIMIRRMARPEEVLVVENDQGEVVRELVKDTDSINLYRNMRECLVYLTHLDYHDTEQKMTGRLQSQVSGGEFSWNNLNTLCWAVGSISGTMSEEDEKKFLVLVIRDLLGLCEQKRGKDNKAVIASNIMYVVGQYPRFLRAHWKFLKTVINKLFEFMHETHEGVQDMACDTFIKIAVKCKRHFVMTQAGEPSPFVDEILTNLSAIICGLAPHQVHVFYEAMGHIVGSQTEPAIQENLIERLMQLPNTIWDEVISGTSHNVNILHEQEVLRNIGNILKTNTATCRSLGYPFVTQLTKIYMDMLNLYKLLSEKVSSVVETNGEQALKDPSVKQMRAVKREILVLISTWLEKAEDDVDNVLDNFVPPLFDAVLFDYQRNVASAREPNVLSLLSTLTDSLKNRLNARVMDILDAVFMCTLEMVNKDMEAWPEHRTNFFALLKTLVHHCFDVLIVLPPEQFKYIVDAVVWAFQHDMRNVAEAGWDMLEDLLDKVATLSDAGAQANFYSTFYMNLLQHVLAVVADHSQVHVAGLTHASRVLCALFRAPEYSIKQPLNPSNPSQNNVDFVFESIFELLHQHFGHLTPDQLRVLIKGFFSFNTSVADMKNHLRDFLIQLKEFVGESNTSELFLEEREAAIQAAQAAKKAVPGLLAPSELDDRDEIV